MSLMSFCRPVQNSLNNLGLFAYVLYVLLSRIGIICEIGVGEKENAGSELVRTRVNDRDCVGVEANEVATCN